MLNQGTEFLRMRILRRGPVSHLICHLQSQRPQKKQNQNRENTPQKRTQMRIRHILRRLTRKRRRNTSIKTSLDFLLYTFMLATLKSEVELFPVKEVHYVHRIDGLDQRR